MAPIDPLSPFSVKNTNGNNGKQRRLRFKQKLKLLKKFPGRLNQKLHLILSSNCCMKEKWHTRHCLRKKITREARRKEKAERDAIAEKVHHLLIFWSRWNLRSSVGLQFKTHKKSFQHDAAYSDLELELKMVTELDFEEGIDLEEFRNSRLNIEEFMMSQRCLKESEYELDFEEGIDLEEFRNSGLNIEQFVMSQRRSKDSDYAAGTSGQPIKKKPKVSGPDSDKLKRKAWRRHGQEKNGTV